MSQGRKDRVSEIIEAYYNSPRAKYVDVVSQVKEEGGLTPAEVRKLKDRLLFIHSDTIIRQAGLLRAQQPIR
jgi:hypothetical protein